MLPHIFTIARSASNGMKLTYQTQGTLHPLFPSVVFITAHGEHIFGRTARIRRTAHDLARI
jgi:molecular chaperone DnaK (HSP70)